MDNRLGSSRSSISFAGIGAAAFALSAIGLALWPTARAGIDFHPIHIDSVIYLCHGLQLSPLDVGRALTMELNLVTLYGQQPWPCYAETGDPSLLLKTYYPRMTLAVAIAALSSFGLPWLVLTVPVIVMAGLGASWGWIVAAPLNRPLWLRCVVLFAPTLSFAWVLWLGSLMTEGIYVLILLASVIVVWLQSQNRLGLHGYFWSLLILGLLLLLTRDSWPLVGVMWGLAVEPLLHKRWTVAGTGMLVSVVRFSRFAVSQVVGFAGAFVVSRLISTLLTPSVEFPASNEPPSSIPMNLADIFFTLRVSFDSVIVGLEQSIQVLDVVSVLLVLTMPILLVVIVLRAPPRMVYFVVVNWLLSMVIVGLVSLCCGGISSYFRYQIPSMFVTLAVAWMPWTRVGGATPISEPHDAEM